MNKIKQITNFDHYLTNDWKMFWIIENKDLESLKQLCHQLKNDNQDIGMYFGCKPWWDLFNSNEADSIKVYVCGMMDFCPIQHAANIDWPLGIKCLLDNQISKIDPKR